MGTVRTDNEIVEMIDTCLNRRDQLSPWSENFLNSINCWYEDKGYLTDKQYETLEKIHDGL